MPLWGHKLVILVLFCIGAYWVYEFAIWGNAHWGFAFAVPVIITCLLIAAWMDGYFSRGGLHRFIREQLPLKLQNLLSNIGLARSDKP
jgi:hypothetical protein